MKYGFNGSRDANDEISLSCVGGVDEQAKDSEERGEGGQDDETFPDDQDSSNTSTRVCLFSN